MVNLSASPWHHGKARRAADAGDGRGARPGLPGRLRERGRRQRRADLRRPLAGERPGRPRPRRPGGVRGGAARRRAPRPGAPAARLSPDLRAARHGRHLSRPRRSACATTRTRAASGTALVALSRRHRLGRRRRPSPPRPSGRRTSSASRCPPPSRRSTRGTTRSALARQPRHPLRDDRHRRGRRRLRGARSAPSSPAGRATSPRRTSRPGCAASS